MSSRKKNTIKRSQVCWYDRPRSPDMPPASPGRRLSAAELESVASSLGLDVSENRFARESDWSRTQRALAYDQGKELERKLHHDGVPKSSWLKGSGVKPRNKNH